MSRSIKCPVASTLDLVGDRWTLLVIRDLLRGRSKFTELRDSVEGIPPAILSLRLKLLEENAILVRRQYQSNPPRFAYQLTAKGHALGVVVGALATWGEKFAESELSLVDDECGHGIRVVYHCPTCARRSPGSRVRMVGTALSAAAPFAALHSPAIQ